MKNFTSIKDTIKYFTPDFLLEIRRRRLYRLSSSAFIAWWKDFSRSSGLSPSFIEMMNYYISTEAFKGSSDFWRYLSKEHILMLAQHGFDNFKQTVARNHYWGEHSLKSPTMRSLLSSNNGSLVEIPIKEVFRNQTFCSPLESIDYNVANILLLDHVLQGGDGELEMVSEPSFGNSIYIEYKGRRVSQELLMSILEYRAIAKHLKQMDRPRFLEIGAGSGRTSYCFHHLFDHPRIVIVRKISG